MNQSEMGAKRVLDLVLGDDNTGNIDEDVEVYMEDWWTMWDNDETLMIVLRKPRWPWPIYNK